jgi:recombination protein RecA
MSEKEKTEKVKVDPRLENAMSAVDNLNAFYKKEKQKVTVETYDQMYKRMEEQRNKGELEIIPSGLEELDLASGMGGFVKGTMVELYGPESSGKSYVGYKTIASCQKLGGVAALVDAEQSAGKEWLKSNGIDTGALIFHNDAVSMEDHLQRIYDMCGYVDMILVDSIAALVPRSEMEGDVGDVGVAAQARVLSPGIRKIMQVAKGKTKKGPGSKKTLIIWINQIRDKVGVMFGNPETTPGGKALKFYCHQRVDVRRTGVEKVKMGEDEVPIAQNSKGTFIKNKVAIPFKKFTFRISFESTLTNPIVLLAQAACERKLFSKYKGEYRYKTLEDDTTKTGATDFIILANWIYKEGLVEEIIGRVREAYEDEKDDKIKVPTFLDEITDETVPPPLVEKPGTEVAQDPNDSAASIIAKIEKRTAESSEGEIPEA